MNRAILTFEYQGEKWVIDSNHLPSKNSVISFIGAAFPEMQKLVEKDGE